MNTAHVSSFVLISILRGQPRTPPSGDNLGVLDYHVKNHFTKYLRGIVGNVLINISPINILPIMLYAARCHQNCQAVLAAVSINGLR